MGGAAYRQHVRSSWTSIAASAGRKATPFPCFLQSPTGSPGFLPLLVEMGYARPDAATERQQHDVAVGRRGDGERSQKHRTHGTTSLVFSVTYSLVT